MKWIFLFLTTTAFANTFDLQGGPKKFSLVIDSRHLTYRSDQKVLTLPIKKCNLSAVRSLNGELLAMVPHKNTPHGLPFLVDGNTYYISAKGKEAKVLYGMDDRIEKYQEEEKKACP